MFLAAQQGMNGWTPGAFALLGCLLCAVIGMLTLIFAQKKGGALLWFVLAIGMFVLTGVIGKK